MNAGVGRVNMGRDGNRCDVWMVVWMKGTPEVQGTCTNAHMSLPFNCPPCGSLLMRDATIGDMRAIVFFCNDSELMWYRGMPTFAKQHVQMKTGRC